MTVHCNQRVQDLERDTDGRWIVTVRDAVTGERRTVRTRFVFVGAGGGALPLLQQAGIPEIRGFGGFPVSGRFLRTTLARAGQRPPGQGLRPGRRRRPADVRAAPGPPPDRRRPLADVRAVRRLLAEVPQGRVAVRPAAQRPPRTTSAPCSGVARTELALTRYLIGELLQSGADRHQTLTHFVPQAEEHDWEHGHRRPAGPGHQARPGDRPRRPAVRHRAGRRRGRLDRRPARRLPRRVDGRVGDAHPARAVLPRPDPGLAAGAAGGDPLLRPPAVRGPGAARRRCGPRRCRCSSSTAEPTAPSPR